MNNNEKEKKNQHLQEISADEEAMIFKTIDTVFDADLDAGLLIIEDRLESLDPAEVGTEYETMKTTLESLWNYFEAIRLIRTETNFIGAYERFESAAEGFDLVGIQELRDLSLGMSGYVAAIIALQSMNVGQVSEILTEVKAYLRNAGRYGRKFEPLIHHIEPEKLFILAVQSMFALDFANAKIWTEQASQAAENVANKYYDEGDPLYNTFKGYAQYYKSFFSFIRAMNDFNQFEFDKLAVENDLEEEAIQAQYYLTKGDIGNILVKNALMIANCLVHMLKSIRDLAEILQNVFSSTFKSDLQALVEIKENITLATGYASEAGPAAVTLIRSCNQLSNQVKNLEMLAKPNKKDFGKFSGLISSALFLPLFLIVSWADFTFAMGLDAYMIMISTLFLALIGGFGYGALKFKGLFP